MKTLNKHTGGVPQLAGFYLVPVSNVLSIYLPNVHVIDNTDIITFEFAEDSMGYTVATIGSRKQEAFRMVFSGFLAGISEQNTDMLNEMAAGEYIIIATDHDENKYVAGTKNTPFKLKFTQSPGPRIGYSITLEARTTVPVHKAVIVEGYENPVCTITLKGNPEVPAHFLSGAGDYLVNDEVTIEATNKIRLSGWGLMIFDQWQIRVYNQGPAGGSRLYASFTWEVFSLNRVHTFTVTQSLTIYAKYIEDTSAIEA